MKNVCRLKLKIDPFKNTHKSRNFSQFSDQLLCVDCELLPKKYLNFQQCNFV